MQTRMRSPAAQGPAIALACMWRQQLLVDALGGPPQRQFAQRGQIARREIMLQRALGLFGDIDLAFLQPLDQIVRREVDQFDGVGAVEHRIRHGLAHPHMGDLRDHVVEALDVLDVDRGIDVDAVGRAVPRRRDSAWDGGCPARWCGRVRRPGRSADGARSAHRGPSPRGSGPCIRAACAAGLRGPSAAPRSPPARGSRPRRPRHRRRPSPWRARSAASRRSCRRRGRRRRRS